MSDRVSTVLRYRRAYANYRQVLLARVLHRFPIIAQIRRSQRSVRLESPLNAYYVAWCEDLGWQYDMDENIVTISSGPELRFRGGLDRGDLPGVFGGQCYSGLDVTDRTVLDIGASIGDTAVYFALRGASRVIAIEPDPVDYRRALENVERSGFSDRIVVVRARVDGEAPGTDFALTAKCGVQTQLGPNGVNAPTVSLGTVVEEYGLEHGILKMDCEGCEYSSLTSNPRSLARFDQIQLEYHRGVQGLEHSLRDAGFVVTRRPRSRRIGELLARRK